jgi:hypothetical protein
MVVEVRKMAVVALSEQAAPHLREMQKDGQPSSFRLVFKGFG